MKKTLLAMLALGAVALPAAPAGAEPLRTNCGFEAISGPGSDTFAGRLYGWGVFVAADGAPENATVTCTMSVRGVLAYTGTFTGTGVVAGTVPIEFTAHDPYDVRVCESDDWGSGHRDLCYDLPVIEVPPPVYEDALEALVPVPGWHDRTCDALRLADSVAPGAYGDVWTSEDGNLYVGLVQPWHC
jgi:hypothetical protein